MHTLKNRRKKIYKMPQIATKSKVAGRHRITINK